MKLKLESMCDIFDAKIIYSVNATNLKRILLPLANIVHSSTESAKTASGPATPSTPSQKAESEPLRAIENISTTITPSSTASSSAISTTSTSTTTTVVNTGTEDGAAPSVASTQSPSSIVSSHNSLKNEKGLLPKAMIKPNVLTHVIEGFVIQEANEPFPVTRQRYTDDADEAPGESCEMLFGNFRSCLWSLSLTQCQGCY